MHYLLGEFLGSLFLILFGGGVVAGVVLKGSKSYMAGWMVIATGWAFAVMIGVFVASSTGSTQADINPAVTLAKLFLGIYYSPVQVIERMAVQFLGCFTGAVLVWLAYLPHWRITDDKEAKLNVFSTTPAIDHKIGNLLTEIIGTFALIFGIGAIVNFAHGHTYESLVPYFVGMLVWGIGLSLGGPTGYAINPARDLGPRIAHALLPIAGKGSSRWQYAWIPVIGPCIGASIGAVFCHLLL
ncbi:MIP/aquaporin family protein [Piscirickettsia litoralis]|uniref:Aquaporin n=1 Tax=Piscirickettsia litoralis TaxID=1891921 RepID=A0ABX3A581_9GAMM|nr:MIP/aquaporin family protein [Piscirickettsia litoralis]ODN44023.1 aquaporin [Piscirickettsia litoralis]